MANRWLSIDCVNNKVGKFPTESAAWEDKNKQLEYIPGTKMLSEKINSEWNTKWFGKNGEVIWKVKKE